jgi:drug/metabolite transporter (DMT)-like permease
MLSNIPHLGEILSFLCAIVWATAVILFKKSGEKITPLGLNLYKNILALTLFILTSLVLGMTLTPKVALLDQCLVLTSGLLGIAISDTFLFKTLNLLGAELTAIISCLVSPLIIILSFFFLGEMMRGYQLLGALLIILAVVVVTRRQGRISIPRHDLFRGIGFGMLCIISSAIGVVLFKPLLDRVPFLWIIEMRLAAGALGAGVFMLFLPERRTIIKSIISASNWHYMLPASFLGAYLSMVIWIGGMKYTQASVATALNQTTNVFVFLLAVLFLKEPVNLIRVIAIVLAFAGALLVTFG